MAGAGAAVVIVDDELMPMRLAETVPELLTTPTGWTAMAQASATLARPGAARAVATQVLAAAGDDPSSTSRARGQASR